METKCFNSKKMGNDFLDDIINDGHIDPLINEQLKCPFCNKLFKSSTTKFKKSII